MIEKDLPIDDIFDGILNFEEEVNQKAYGKHPSRRWYPFDRKLLVIAYLEIYQNDRDGKMIPQFAYVSRLFNIPKTTIRDWWLKRKEITGNKTKVNGLTSSYIPMKLLKAGMVMSDVLAKKDFNKMEAGDLIYFFNTTINILCLFKRINSRELL